MSMSVLLTSFIVKTIEDQRLTFGVLLIILVVGQMFAMI